MRITKTFAVLLVAAIGVIGSGCSGTTVEPEVHKVKRVAIVSLYADGTIPWTPNKIWTNGTPPKGKMENFDPQTKQRVATEAYKAFSAEFQRIGWTAVPMAQVASNAAYRKLFGPPETNPNSNVLAKATNYIVTNNNASYFTAPGLFPIAWTEGKKPGAAYTLDVTTLSFEKEKDLQTKLAELTGALGVDAVALVYVDYCYSGAFNLIGPEKAKMMAGSWLKMVNADKKVVVDMKAPRNRCEGKQGESDTTVPMFKGSITIGRYLMADTLVKAFIEATQASAKVAVDQIKEAISK